MATRKVWFWYERPESVTTDMEIPDDLEDFELHEWMLDNAPIAHAPACEWDFVGGE